MRQMALPLHEEQAERRREPECPMCGNDPGSNPENCIICYRVDAKNRRDADLSRPRPLVLRGAPTPTVVEVREEEQTLFS